MSKNLRKEEVVVPVKVAGVSKMWHEDWRDKKISCLNVTTETFGQSLVGPEDQSK